jgi:hypothetical protein
MGVKAKQMPRGNMGNTNQASSTTPPIAGPRQVDVESVTDIWNRVRGGDIQKQAGDLTRNFRPAGGFSGPGYFSGDFSGRYKKYLDKTEQVKGSKDLTPEEAGLAGVGKDVKGAKVMKNVAGFEEKIEPLVFSAVGKIMNAAQRAGIKTQEQFTGAFRTIANDVLSGDERKAFNDPMVQKLLFHGGDSDMRFTTGHLYRQLLDQAENEKKSTGTGQGLPYGIKERQQEQPQEQSSPTSSSKKVMLKVPKA